MRALLSAAIAAVWLTPLAVNAGDSQPPQPPSDDTKLICRQIVHQGTLGRTECHTKRQWDSLREYQQRQLRETQQRGLLSAPH